MRISTLIYILTAWNTIVLLLFGIDKLRAKRDKWRISEATLITTSFLLGGVGAILGMVLFHHKVSKTKFRVLVPLSLVVTIAVMVVGVYYLQSGVLPQL